MSSNTKTDFTRYPKRLGPNPRRCALCRNAIRSHQFFFDGGNDNVAHEHCAHLPNIAEFVSEQRADPPATGPSPTIHRIFSDLEGYGGSILWMPDADPPRINLLNGVSELVGSIQDPEQLTALAAGIVAALPTAAPPQDPPTLIPPSTPFSQIVDLADTAIRTADRLDIENKELRAEIAAIRASTIGRMKSRPVADAERSTASVHYWETAYDGPGWYYVIEEYPDEGSCGAFSTAIEAKQHARDCGYAIGEIHAVDPFGQGAQQATDKKRDLS